MIYLPIGPRQDIEFSSTSQQQRQFLQEESCTSKEQPTSRESSPEAADNPSEEVHQEANDGEDSYNFAQNPYVQQYYSQYFHLYHVLDKGLGKISSEMHYIGRNVSKIASGMMECSSSMSFFVARMLSLQRETLYALDKANAHLESAVTLLHEIKENKPRPQSSSSATRYMEQHKGDLTSNGSNTHHKEEHRHRSRSEDRSTPRRKKFKDY